MIPVGLLLVLLASAQTVNGITTYFSWTHESSYDSNIKQYVLDHFHTDTHYSFGWTFSGDTDSLKLVHDPDGSGYVLQVYYKSGTYSTHGCSSGKPCHRGISFYIMPPSFYDHGHTFAAMEYEVYFKSGFEFASGGKLPGLFGGGRDSCKGCSGEADGCFSARLMWRAGGHYEIYAYIPYSAQDGGWDSWCNKYGVGERVKCHPRGCGTEIGLTSTDDHKFVTGRWHKIRQEVYLGPPNGHGRISLWVDGELKVQIKNIVLRTSSSISLGGVYFTTFYGGSSSYYGKHGDSYTYFRNIKITDEKYDSHALGEVFVGK